MRNQLTTQNKPVAMTTIELLAQINEFRAMSGQPKIRNNDFIGRVEDEIEDLPACETFVSNNQKVKGYTLNGDQCLLVGMRENKTVRLKVLTWLKDLSTTKQQAHQIPQTLSEALQLAADQAKQLEEQAPKVAFVNNCVDRGVLMTATQVAQKHKLSAVKLNRFLDEVGGVYNKSIKRGRAFTQSFIEQELGEMKQTEQGYSQSLFTTKGEQWINAKLISEGAI